MNKRKLLILASTVCMVLMLAVPFMAACAQPATTPTPTATPTPTPAEPIVLKAVCFAPLTSLDTSYFLKVFAERVNEQSKGQLTINVLGGPEVIPGAEQAEAAKKGVVDIVVSFPELYKGAMPEAESISIMGLTFAEERSGGYSDFLDKVHREKMNLHYLGRGNWHSGYYIWTKKSVAKLADLAGMKVRCNVAQDPLAKAVGGIPTTVATAEAYGALERGVVDAIAANISMISTNKIYEVVKYRAGSPVMATSLIFIINQDSWNKLPKNMQDLITGIMLKFDTEIPDYWGKEEQVQMQKMADAGMKIIELPSEEVQKITAATYNGAWEVLKPKISAENYTKLRSLAKY